MQGLKILHRALRLCLLLPGLVCAANPVGEITLATGQATATARDGSVRNVVKGGNVYSGEFINTGPNSYLNIKFRDGGLMLLRPNTRFQIEKFEYEVQPKPVEAEAPPAASAPKPEETKLAEKPAEASPHEEVPANAPVEQTQTAPRADTPAPAPAPQRAFFRLIKGGLRTVTGLIGHGNIADYRLSTPTATIGIRGTEYLTWTCNLACAKDPVVAATLKSVFGENFDPSKSTVIGTIKGLIEVTNTKTGEKTPVKAGQYFLSTPTGDIPLSREPEFIAKDRPPSPEGCVKK